MLHRTREAIHC